LTPKRPRKKSMIFCNRLMVPTLFSEARSGALAL
jgi:hypothetical protein